MTVSTLIITAIERGEALSKERSEDTSFFDSGTIKKSIVVFDDGTVKIEVNWQDHIVITVVRGQWDLFEAIVEITKRRSRTGSISTSMPVLGDPEVTYPPYR